MSNRVYEIKEMIECLLEKNELEMIKKVHSLVDWKHGVDESVQKEPRKLDDIYYYLKGILVAKGIKE